MSKYTDRIRMISTENRYRIAFAAVTFWPDAPTQFEAELARIVAEETAGLRAEVARLVAENARFTGRRSPGHAFAAERAAYQAALPELLAMGYEGWYVVILGSTIVGMERTFDAALELKYRACGLDMAMVKKVTETEEIFNL